MDNANYCGWLKFRGVPIFLVFVEGSNHDFQYLRNGNFLYELWTKILWPQILNSTNMSFLCRLRSMATHRDHFVRRLSVRLSHFPELCFAGDTCIPRNAATIFVQSTKIDIHENKAIHSAVNCLLFASLLCSRYLWGWSFREYKTPWIYLLHAFYT